jgi:hypothetical protein
MHTGVCVRVLACVSFDVNYMQFVFEQTDNEKSTKVLQVCQKRADSEGERGEEREWRERGRGGDTHTHP